MRQNLVLGFVENINIIISLSTESSVIGGFETIGSFLWLNKNRKKKVQGKLFE
jgi:hypothetical protein